MKVNKDLSSPSTNDLASSLEDDDSALSLCFSSRKIANFILSFLDYNIYAIFSLRKVSSRFNKWIRPFVFSHLEIDYSRYQKYVSRHPLPFTPCRIVLKEKVEELSLLTTHITLPKEFCWLNSSICSSNITHLKFPRLPGSRRMPRDFYQSIDHLPLLTHLELGDDFNQPVDKLLSSLMHLTLLRFGMKFNQSVNHLPNSLKTIVFGDYFNQKVDYLPPSITKIVFGEMFNQTVDKLPPSITKIVFGVCFNEKVDKLPSSTTYISFGLKFNQPVDKLPSSITHLIFGKYFNQPVNNLPPSLQHLSFGFDFNQSVDSLPSNLKHLYFGESFNQSIEKLPSSLIGLSFVTLLHSNIPPITSLNIDKWESYHRTILPTSITHLSFGNCFTKKVGELPDSITHLRFGRFFNCKIKSFPKSLLVLILGCYFNQPLDNLPNKLTHLIFEVPYCHNYCFFFRPLRNLPESLCLLVGTFEKLHFNHPLELRPSVVHYPRVTPELKKYFESLFKDFLSREEDITL